MNAESEDRLTLQELNQDSRQISGGNHYGSIRLLGTFSDFVLAESVYPRSFATPLHAHDADCFVVFTRGSFREDFKRSSLDCSRGSVLFRPAGEVHRDNVGAKGARCVIIELPPNFVGRMNEAGVHLRRPMHAPDHEHFLSRIYRECSLGDELSSLVMESLAIEIACGLFRIQKIRTKPPLWLKRAREYLEAMFRSPVTLNDVAAEVQIHPTHLARSFRQHYGCTIGEYVRRMRVGYACEQLQTSQADIALVALASGFSNQAHFSRVFKAYTGLTPGEYRRI